MAASQELLVDGLVAGAAIGGCQVFRDSETVVVVALLAALRLVALQAADMLLRMHAHFVFVNDAVLLAIMAFGTFAGCANQRGAGLARFATRPGAVYQKGTDGECKGQNHGDEVAPKSAHFKSVCREQSRLWQGEELAGKSVGVRRADG